MSVSLTGKYARHIVDRFSNYIDRGASPRGASVAVLQDVFDAGENAAVGDDKITEMLVDAAAILAIAEDAVKSS